MTLKELIEIASKSVADCHRARGTVPPPHIVAVTPTGISFFFVPELGGPATDDLLAHIRKGLAEIDAIACVLVVEAWSVSDDVSDAYRASGARSMEHFPGREEIVSYFAEDDTGMEQAVQRITRLPGLPGFMLGALEHRGKPTESRGRMIGLLPQRGAKH